MNTMSTSSSTLLDLNASKIESWFRADTRGAVRVADIALQLHVPIGYLYDQPMRERLEARGVATLRIPGVRYSFFYLVADGVPDTDALRERWSIEVRSSNAERPGDHSRGRQTEIVRSVVAFLKANKGQAYTSGQIANALGIADRWLRYRPNAGGERINESLLRAAGVTVSVLETTPPLRARHARNAQFRTRRAPTRTYAWLDGAS